MQCFVYYWISVHYSRCDCRYKSKVVDFVIDFIQVRPPRLASLHSPAAAVCLLLL